jgi:hypothetical protein
MRELKGRAKGMHGDGLAPSPTGRPAAFTVPTPMSPRWRSLPPWSRPVFAIIAGIQREGTTILMVERNAYLALQLATRAYVMKMGPITLQGPARALLDDEHVKRAYLGG